MEVDSQMWLELGDLDSFWPMGLMVCEVISGDFVQAAPPPTTTREVAASCSSRGGVLHPARFRQVSSRKRHFLSVPCHLSAVSCGWEGLYVHLLPAPSSARPCSSWPAAQPLPRAVEKLALSLLPSGPGNCL